MAIYTNYGRYLKAREFKEILSGKDTEAYMLFGIGNHLWDSKSEIPIAPYNTSIIAEEPSIHSMSNQFYDKNINQYFIKETETIRTVFDGTPEGDLSTIVKDYVPPFPCIWQHYTDNESNPVNDVLISTEDGAPVDIFRDEYHLYYIKTNGERYDWYKIGSSSNPISGSAGTSAITDMPQAQYFSELVLRGDALTHNALYLNDGVAPQVPVGLLGAIKCSVDFVKDIGTEEDNQYVGKASQFFYGDRYWEIVSPDEKFSSDDQDVLPHHLIITSTINPRSLHETLKLDQNIIPRQIAIFFRKKKDGKDGAPVYKVYKNLFNFGQYEQEDFKNTESLPAGHGEILNFVPAYYTTVDGNRVLHHGNIEDRFNLLLVDYIKGSVRADNHAIDRFGYVVGF